MTAARGPDRVPAREQRERFERVDLLASVDPQRGVRRVEREAHAADQRIAHLLEPIHRFFWREAAIGHPAGAPHQNLAVVLLRGFEVAERRVGLRTQDHRLHPFLLGQNRARHQGREGGQRLLETQLDEVFADRVEELARRRRSGLDTVLRRDVR